MDAFEKSIERELKKISNFDIKSFETVNSDIKMVVNKLFERFKDYTNNTNEKKKKSLHF